MAVAAFTSPEAYSQKSDTEEFQHADAALLLEIARSGEVEALVVDPESDSAALIPLTDVQGYLASQGQGINEDTEVAFRPSEDAVLPELKTVLTEQLPAFPDVQRVWVSDVKMPSGVEGIMLHVVLTEEADPQLANQLLQATMEKVPTDGPSGLRPPRRRGDRGLPHRDEGRRRPPLKRGHHTTEAAGGTGSGPAAALSRSCASTPRSRTSKRIGTPVVADGARLAAAAHPAEVDPGGARPHAVAGPESLPPRERPRRPAPPPRPRRATAARAAACGSRPPPRSRPSRTHRLSRVCQSFACCTSAMPSVTRTSRNRSPSSPSALLASANSVARSPRYRSYRAAACAGGTARPSCANRSTRSPSRSPSPRRYPCQSRALQAANASANSTNPIRSAYSARWTSRRAAASVTS